MNLDEIVREEAERDGCGMIFDPLAEGARSVEYSTYSSFEPTDCGVRRRAALEARSLRSSSVSKGVGARALV